LVSLFTSAPVFGWTISLIGFLKKNVINFKIQETKLIRSIATDVANYSKQVLERLVEM
jgi:hypothetical protein